MVIIDNNSHGNLYHFKQIISVITKSWHIMSIVHSSGSSDGVRGGKKPGYLRSPLVAILFHVMSIALEDIGGVPGMHAPPV